MTINLSLQNSLQKVLNSHGHGLHYAIIRKMEELLEGQGFPWRLAAIELPVEVKDEHTRIDIVLKHVSRSVYVICECKRVNPALSEWAFVRAPYSTPPDSSEWLLAESVMFDGQRSLQSSVDRICSSKRIFHIAVELKSDKAGDQYGHGRGGIEGAATQVLRSVNGFVHFLNNHRQVLVVNDPTSIIPVIFTTASLHAADADLGTADLETGNVVLSPGTKIENAEWLYYQYNQSPGLRHSVHTSHHGKSIAEVMQAEFTRTIAIINPSHLESFFNEAIGFLR
jgi:hypothetical protein